MSAAEATRFVAHVETDTALSERIAALGTDNPAAVHALVRAQGFDCSADEIKEAFVEAHGEPLTAEQLDAISGGSAADIALFAWLGVLTGAPAAASAGI